MRYAFLALALPALTTALSGCDESPSASLGHSGAAAEWPQWGGSEAGLRYSPLTQITPANVKQLQVAWTYRVGGMPPDDGDRISTWLLEVTPIVADGRMYLCTPLNKVVALDPESGGELWSYDPHLDSKQVLANNCRGVTYYRDQRAAAGTACAMRIFTGTLDARLIALDAATGKPCADFGNGGTVNLLDALGEVRPGEYNVTSPPTVVADRVLLSARGAGLERVDIPAGVIRAYDARTGELSWAWNPLPPGVSDADLAPPGETYARGTVDAWSVYSVDRERGLVFIPTGNPQPDYYGGQHHGLDYYGSSVVALAGATGRVVWNFQVVHHDLWDHDVPSQPVLFDFPTPQGRVPAVAQATKQGHIFILHRETGEPLVPVKERRMPQFGGVPEERPALTQPFPANPAYDLYPGDLDQEDMWGFTPWDRAKCRKQLRELRNDGAFTLPSTRGSLDFPGPSGITNWGGIAIDPSRDILIVNTSRIAWITTLVPRNEVDRRMATGEVLFRLEGSPYTYARRRLASSFGVPCNPPPWGTLTAIDMRAGKRLWEIPLGTTRELAPFPLWLNLGVPNFGGAIVTASGLTFIAATTDRYFRAFDTSTGELLWQTRLPAPGHAVPLTYRLRDNGKQYVVIAAGGRAGIGVEISDHVIAYALED